MKKFVWRRIRGRLVKIPVKAEMPQVKKVINKVKNTRYTAKGLSSMLDDVSGSGMTVHQAANLKQTANMIAERPAKFMNKSKNHFDKIKKFLKDKNK